MIVGVIPNAADFAHPADRRRYIPYFQTKSIAFEAAKFDERYDAVYISIAADLGKWVAYKRHQLERGSDVRVIFDLSDCYLMAGPVTDALRAAYHYAVRRTSAFSLSYKQTLVNMMNASDVVLCGSEEQKAILDAYHPHVVVVRDDFRNDLRSVKHSYGLVTPGAVNVFWEGFSHGNIRMFEQLRDILDGLGTFKVDLHLVTDSQYCRFGGSHLCHPTFSVLQKVFARSDVRFHLYDWNAVTFSAVATACDLALIPIPDDPVMVMKPENKLLLLWSLGLPAIVSATPSYTRVMRAVGEDLACSRLEDWKEKVVGLASSQDARERYMASARRYLHAHMSPEALIANWDRIFLGPVPGRVDSPPGSSATP